MVDSTNGNSDFYSFKFWDSCETLAGDELQLFHCYICKKAFPEEITDDVLHACKAGEHFTFESVVIITYESCPQLAQVHCRTNLKHIEADLPIADILPSKCSDCTRNNEPEEK